MLVVVVGLVVVVEVVDDVVVVDVVDVVVLEVVGPAVAITGERGEPEGGVALMPEGALLFGYAVQMRDNWDPETTSVTVVR